MKKKLLALFLAAAMLAALSACGAKPAGSTAASGEAAATAEPQPEAEPTAAPEATPSPTEEPAPTEAPTASEPDTPDESAPIVGAQTVELEDFILNAKVTFSFTTPDAGWYMKKSGNINLYNEESFDDIYSNSPVIQLCLKKDLDTIDRYKSDMENLTELPNRTIAGLDMAGRSYTMYGMDWTQYYAELPSGIWVTILSSGVSLEPGSEGGAILDSLEIS